MNPVKRSLLALLLACATLLGPAVVPASAAAGATSVTAVVDVSASTRTSAVLAAAQTVRWWNYTSYPNLTYCLTAGAGLQRMLPAKVWAYRCQRMEYVSGIGRLYMLQIYGPI